MKVANVLACEPEPLLTRVSHRKHPNMGIMPFYGLDYCGRERGW